MKASLFKFFSEVLLAAFMFRSCASVPTSTSSENVPDKVISRIDNMDQRPAWVTESEPFRIENGQVISIGVTTLGGDNRVEAVQRVAANNAKAAIASAIETRLETLFQNAEEGTAIDSSQVRYVGSEATSLVTNAIRPGKFYWEKVATSLDSGERVTRYKIFSSVTIPEADYRKAVLDAIRKAQAKGGISADFAKKAEAQWDRLSGTTEIERKTSSEGH